MKWRKRGLIFDPSAQALPGGCTAFAQSPQAIVFDSFLVFALLAFRRRRQIRAWWQARRQSAPAALASDESLSSAP